MLNSGGGWHELMVHCPCFLITHSDRGALWSPDLHPEHGCEGPGHHKSTERYWWPLIHFIIYLLQITQESVSYFNWLNCIFSGHFLYHKSSLSAIRHLHWVKWPFFWLWWCLLLDKDRSQQLMQRLVVLTFLIFIYETFFLSAIFSKYN